MEFTPAGAITTWTNQSWQVSPSTEQKILQRSQNGRISYRCRHSPAGWRICTDWQQVLHSWAPGRFPLRKSRRLPADSGPAYPSAGPEQTNYIYRSSAKELRKQRLQVWIWIFAVTPMTARFFPETWLSIYSGKIPVATFEKELCTTLSLPGPGSGVRTWESAPTAKSVRLQFILTINVTIPQILYREMFSWT